MADRTPNPYNVTYSFDAWLDEKVVYPVHGYISHAVGKEIETPCFAILHHELSSDALAPDDVIGSENGKEIYGRMVKAEARIVCYVGVISDGYDEPQADHLFKMRNVLFGLMRFRPRISIRNYETDTDFADLEVSDQGYITVEDITEESAISDVRDSYILLEQAFRVRYQYVHQVLED